MVKEGAGIIFDREKFKHIRNEPGLFHIYCNPFRWAAECEQLEQIVDEIRFYLNKHKRRKIKE